MMIWGMCYNTVYDELFFADFKNQVVRAVSLRDEVVCLHEVYKDTAHRIPRSSSLYSVCHLRESDTLIVCSWGWCQTEFNNCLVALCRSRNGWREADRKITTRPVHICCALNDSRVFVGEFDSTYLELFQVTTGPRIEHIKRIHVSEVYKCFSATGGSDTYVAMSYWSDQSVRVYRLRSYRLEKVASIDFERPTLLLWLNDRILLSMENRSKAIISLEFNGFQLNRSVELITCNVRRWCIVNNGLAIFDEFKDLLHFSIV